MPTKWPSHTHTHTHTHHSMDQRRQISGTAVSTDYILQLRLQRLNKRKKETYNSNVLEHAKFKFFHVYVSKTVYYN